MSQYIITGKSRYYLPPLCMGHLKGLCVEAQRQSNLLIVKITDAVKALRAKTKEPWLNNTADFLEKDVKEDAELIFEEET